MILKTDIKNFAKLFILEDGKPIQLEYWQLESIIHPVFYQLNDDGTRRINLALCGMPKKNGKSTLSALVAAYGLLADGEPFPEIYGIAGSKDQAKIIFNQTAAAIRRSPILRQEVEIYRDVIHRKDNRGFYKVLSSDAPQQHGLNPSMVLGDEIWNQPNYDLWEAMTTSPARPQPLHFIVSYAGYEQWEGNLLWDLYQRGLSGADKRMHFYWSNENKASWVTKEYLAQQRERLPEHIYLRLHENRWTSGSGAFLTRKHVEDAISPDLENRYTPERGNWYFCGLDLGLTRDRTAMCIVHRDQETDVLIVDHLAVWEPPKGGEVDIQEVETAILSCHRHHRLHTIVFDTWQAKRTMQLFRQYGLNVEAFTFSGNDWTRLTQNLLGLFKDKRIKMFEHRELIKELLSVRVVEKSYGYRIDHDSGAHDDCVVALGMAALSAMSFNLRRAGSYRNRHRRADRRTMFPGAMRGTVKMYDRKSGEVQILG